MPPSAPGRLGVAELEGLVEAGEIDTVVACLTDVQGRLQGKRLHARYFLDEVVAHGTEGCNYLLAVDVDMNTVGGYAISCWERGYGDFVLRPDLGTLRRVPWLPGTAMVLCDLLWLDGAPVAQSPRQILRRPGRPGRRDGVAARRRHRAGVPRLRGHLRAGLGQAVPRAHPGQPVQRGLLDPRHRRGWSRCCATSATPCTPPGCRVESAKGECNHGQHEIAFRYGDVLRRRTTTRSTRRRPRRSPPRTASP